MSVNQALRSIRSSDSQKSRGFHFAAIGLLLFGALVRIVGFLQNASLSGDEAMLALSIGPRSFAELLQPLDYGQVAPVPFLWAERVMIMVGGVSGYTLRVIPLLTGIVLLWVVYRLGEKLLGKVDGLMALTLSATSFPLIRFSVEVKPYILDALVSAVLVWVAVRLLDKLEDGWRWAWLAITGAVGVLLSAPALLVCVALLTGLGIASVRRRRAQYLGRLGLLAGVWGAIFFAAYVSWYAANAGAPYMRAFWAETFLRPGTPRFLPRLWHGLSELACTLTCWRGVVGLWPLLLLLALIGVVYLARRRGLEFAVFLGGPIAGAFGASALGSYPIATRLLLFSAPLLAILVGSGAAVIARTLESSWPSLRARWVLLLLVYPSVIPAAALAFVPQGDWGFHGEEVRPLAELYRDRGRNEPVYVFPRAVPAWVFHTTDWSTADSARLSWVAQIAGPAGPGFVNGPSRGRRLPGDGSDLVYDRGGWNELYGTSTGAQGRMGVGYSPPEPDPGWAESEVWRIREAAKPYAWIVLSDYAHGRLDERAILMRAVTAAGGQVVFTQAAPNAVLYRVLFHPLPIE